MAIQLEKILVPIDFSDYSIQALSYAAAFARALDREPDAEIELVHVVESSPYEVYQKVGFTHSVPIVERAGAAVPRADQQYIVHDVIEETRDQLICLTNGSMKSKVQVRHGHVVSELLSEIEAYKPHLVVMCTHGWSGLKHLVLGSVVERIVRLSTVPVLTIRADGE